MTIAEKHDSHELITHEGESQPGQPTERPAWFDANLDKLPEAGQKLLEEYSLVPRDEVLSHVLSVRDRAFAIWAYPCIGQFRFLNYSLPKHPYYGPVLTKLRGGATFLDAGCCFGQELRFLVHTEHIPGSQLYGFDLELGFMQFGNELFRDRDRLGATFLTVDMLGEPDKAEIDILDGKMDIVHCASVLHVFGWDRMLQAAKRLVALTRPQAGSMIVGNQLGSRNPGEYPIPTMQGYNYRHNKESMGRFWRQVGEDTGTRWRVESGMFIPPAVTQNLGHSWAKVDPGMAMIWFMATRL